jgi:CelD/BcsL family acetyltransferase involved in cellulose biosynthesis
VASLLWLNVVGPASTARMERRSMHSIREFNDISDLDVYRDAWRALHAETPRASFFQSLDWLEVYWRHFGKRQKLRVLVVVDAHGTPAGILPLVVRWETTRVGRLRFLTYPLDYWGSFYGPIGPNPGLILDAGLKHIAETKPEWDAIELRWVGEGEFDPAGVSEKLASNGFAACQTVVDRTALILLEESTWHDYFASRGTKWRNNYRRWERRALELGEVSLLRYRPLGEQYGDGYPRWDLYDECVSLARRSWQGSSRTGTTLSHASVSEFLRDVHEAASKAGGVDLNLLMAGSEPVAFAYNYYHNGYVFGLRIGYDERYQKYALGNLIYARVIQDSFARCDRVYDMGPGHVDIKRPLLTDEHAMYRYSHFRRGSLRGQLVRLKRLWDSQEVATIPEADLSPSC